jgi:hypothetical protein
MCQLGVVIWISPGKIDIRQNPLKLVVGGGK